MSYYHYLATGILLLTMAIATLKTLDAEAERLEKLGIQYLDCGTSGGVYGLERGYCLMVGGASGAVSVCAPIFRALAPGITVLHPAQTHTLAQLVPSTDGYTVVDQVQDTLSKWFIMV